MSQQKTTMRQSSTDKRKQEQLPYNRRVTAASYWPEYLEVAKEGKSRIAFTLLKRGLRRVKTKNVLYQEKKKAKIIKRNRGKIKNNLCCVK